MVAGASGMAGRAVVSHLLRNEPEMIVRASSYRQKGIFPLHSRLECMDGDLRSSDDCHRIARECDAVIMLAATTGGIAQQRSEPWKQINDNLFMNAQLLEAMHMEGVKKIVMVGSATCYQDFTGTIKEEELDWAKDPHEAYLGVGWVSRYLEKLALFWNKKTDLSVAFVRAANIFGPYAKFDPAVSNFIPAIIRKAVNETEPLEIWGSPDATRDVIYVEDFASACAALLRYDEMSYNVFNVGSSNPTRVDDVVRWALQSARREGVEVCYTESAPTSVKSRVLDCQKLTQATGWKPQFTIEDGVKHTLEWWKKNKESWKR